MVEMCGLKLYVEIVPEMRLLKLYQKGVRRNCISNVFVQTVFEMSTTP